MPSSCSWSKLFYILQEKYFMFNIPAAMHIVQPGHKLVKCAGY